MAKKSKKTNPGIVLPGAMVGEQLRCHLDLRNGSRSSSHLTAQQRASQRNSKAGKSWRREVW
jgi:hypothetical protein